MPLNAMASSYTEGPKDSEVIALKNRIKALSFFDRSPFWAYEKA